MVSVRGRMLALSSSPSACSLGSLEADLELREVVFDTLVGFVLLVDLQDAAVFDVGKIFGGSPGRKMPV